MMLRVRKGSWKQVRDETLRPLPYTMPFQGLQLKQERTLHVLHAIKRSFRISSACVLAVFRLCVVCGLLSTTTIDTSATSQ